MIVLAAGLVPFPVAGAVRSLSVDESFNVLTTNATKVWNFRAGDSNAVASLQDITNSFGRLLTNGQMVYLAVNGNDATGVRGNLAFPFLTYSNAVEACRDNDTLLINGGRYFAYSAFQGYADNTTTRRAAANIIGKTNITIQGIGNPTIWYTNQCDVLDIFASTNITVRDLTMECTIRLPGSGMTNTSATIEMRGNSASCKFINVRMLNYPDHGITGSFQSVTNCLVENCFFYNGGYSNGVTVGGLVQDGAAIVPGAYWTIRNCDFDFCFRGIELIYTTLSALPTRNVVIKGNRFRRFYADAPIWSQNQVSGTDGFFDIDVEDNRIYDCNNLSQTYAGISMGGGSIRLKIHNNRIIDTTVNSLASCIQVSTFGANNVEACEISGNYTEGGSAQAIVLWDVGSSGVVTNCLIARNKSRRTTGQGIAMSGRDSKIVNNDTSTTVGPGVYLWDNSGGGGRRNTIADNDMAGCSAGVSMDAGCSNTVVINNRISGYSAQPILDAALPGHNLEALNWTPNGVFSGTNNVIVTRDFAVSFQTTDNTTNTAYSFTMRDNTSCRVVVDIVGYNSTSSAGYTKTGTFKSVSGTVTLVGGTTSSGTAEDDAAYESILDTSANVIRVRVAGNTGKTVNWGIVGKVIYPQ